jgi:hypothetical protein
LIAFLQVAANFTPFLSPHSAWVQATLPLLQVQVLHLTFQLDPSWREDPEESVHPGFSTGMFPQNLLVQVAIPVSLQMQLLQSSAQVSPTFLSSPFNNPQLTTDSVGFLITGIFPQNLLVQVAIPVSLQMHLLQSSAQVSPTYFSSPFTNPQLGTASSFAPKVTCGAAHAVKTRPDRTTKVFIAQILSTHWLTSHFMLEWFGIWFPTPLFI